MPSRLRSASGEPSLRVRLAAALVVVGLVVATAPIVVLPLFRLVAHVLR